MEVSYMSNHSTTVDSLLNQLDKVRANGRDKWMACCPAHDDQGPSLSIGLGSDDRILLHCFAGCSIEEVTSALGIEPRDLFADRGNPLPPLSISPTRRKPTRTGPASSPGISRRELTNLLEHELWVLLSSIGHYQQRKTPDPRDKGRPFIAAQRIIYALEALYDT
jgi:hypothetical protein